MFARTQSQIGKSIPSFMLSDLNNLLNKIYGKKGTFNTYGFIYQEEFMLVISYNKDKNTTPVTLKVSTTVDYKKSWDKLVNFVGIFWDSYFKDSSDSYFASWTSYDDFFYLVTREDVELTLQAEKLLNLH